MSAVTSFGRLVPRRTWTDSQGRGLILWNSLFVLCVLFSIVLVTLLVDLLTAPPIPEAQLFDASAQLDFHLESTESDIGLWVQAIRYADSPGWSWLPWVCRNVSQFQTRRSALCLLIGIGLLNVIFMMFARSRARTHAVYSARKTSTQLRKSIHRQTLRLGPSDLTSQRHQAAFRLFTDVVDEIRDALVQYRLRWVRAIINIPLVLSAVLLIDWRLALQCLIPAMMCWWVYRYERRRGAAQRLLAESHAETEARFLANDLKQTRLVRGYNVEEFEESLFEKHLERLTNESFSGRRLESNAIRVARSVVAACMAIVLMLIGLKIIAIVNPIPVASAVALTFGLGVLTKELASLERAFGERRKLVSASDHVYRFLDEIPQVGQAVGAKFIQPVSKSINFETVYYHNQGHEILRGIDLRIEAGTQVALASLDPLLPKAIAYMLPRFIEPSRGRVLFDGEDIAWGTLESIHAETLYVGGDDPVLSGTVLENLICGDSRYSMQDAIEAAKTVHVNKYISSMPLGYETTLGEHGATIGVGEAFQLGLARAILRNPAVLIIQEPDLILEEELRASIDDAYQRVAKDRTVIYLPSRLSTIRRSDQVVLLHDGVVEGIGSHVDLRKSSDLYRHWDYITFNAFSRESRRLKSDSRHSS